MNSPTVKTNRITNDEKLSSEELTEFMNHNGLSTKEFSEILGVTEQAVKLWKNGLRDFSITNSRLIRLFEKYPQLLKEF